jgi:hypothetical protein
MVPILTEQMRKALAAENGQPIKLVDDQTKQLYYVITAEQFDAVRALIAEGDSDPRELYPLIAKTAAEAGWDDPAMDEYNDYDAHRP